MRERQTKDPSTNSTFPHWVALGSLAFVLLLFFSNTAEALRERETLDAMGHDLVLLRGEYEAAIGDLLQQTRLGHSPANLPRRDRPTASEPSFDLQALLVAIDRLGYTPHELCAAHPERAPPDPAAPDPAAPDPAAPDPATEPPNGTNGPEPR